MSQNYSGIDPPNLLTCLLKTAYFGEYPYADMLPAPRITH